MALLTLLEMGASAATRLASRDKFSDIYPTTSPFTSLNIGFSELGPKPVAPAVERLMAAASRLSQLTDVPYVFGGRNLASEQSLSHKQRSGGACQECTACIQKNSLPANSTLGRYSKCAACRRCGIDCSGFVSRVFSEAGIKYGFADTSSLNVAGEGILQKQYGFSNMGRNLMLVQPGDLILGKGHVVLVLAVNKGLGTIDFIHASRGSKRTKVGGIEIRRSQPMERLQLNVKKILRHMELMPAEDSGDNLGYVEFLWFNVKQNLIANNWI